MDRAQSVLPWQTSQWAKVEAAWRNGRFPHALMLQGVDGVGKVFFAYRLAGLILGDSSKGEAAFPIQTHPDFLHVTLPEGKNVIGIDQIRALANHLSLTSHQGGFKVALISPAHAMTLSAANGLLKTLEEPTHNTVLILSTAVPSRLPATVLSRCHRVRFSAPSAKSALSWLEAREARPDWEELLTLAFGAPLKASQLAATGFAERGQSLSHDLQSLAAGESDPLAVAARWVKEEPRERLRWLGTVVMQIIRERYQVAEAPHPAAPPLDMRNIDLCGLFEYLDEVHGVIARLDTSLNLQLAIEALLIPWAQGLKIPNPVTQLRPVRGYS